MSSPTFYVVPRQRVTLVRDGSLKSDWRQFHNSSDVYKLASSCFYKDADREMFHAILLDAKHRMIAVNLVSIGSLSDSIVHPREAFKPAVACSASAVIFTHNHPSGDPAPSRDDRLCTERLVKAGTILGIKVLDHIVCGEGDYFSFADAGFLAQVAMEPQQ